MGKLTTHVLDTASGRPASGVLIVVSRIGVGGAHVLKQATTNDDGRVDAPLLQDEELHAGVYELAFHVGAYFARDLHDRLAFLDIIPLRFGVGDPQAHYHVPLLVTPWSYSTYRGS